MAGKAVYKSEAARKRALSNLRPRAIDTRPDAHEIKVKGQRAAVAVIKHKRALRDICDTLLALPCPDGAASLGDLQDAAKALANGRGEPLDVYEAATLAQVVQALQGSTAAYLAVRDSAGDKPTDKLQADVAQVTAGDLELLRKLDASGDLDSLAGAQKG